ncbi:UNKNOWN [Stylonychia lemnae]|uniref:Uncharacterized protein n=1 Tax=Stylonychia lemnae TaxID=5949 RepID=A0A078A4I8_STYLE|nr:UNKNOWN [Stylonychia lemnae]|eukprot:CDW77082.1 UNKNOWN [Stylonychia lemnae]
MTIYYLCTGSTKYNQENANVIARENKHIELPKEYNKIQTLFDKMIQLEAQNRPSASQLKEDLMKFIDEESPIFQNYQSSLLTHLMNQRKSKLQKLEEEYEKQIQRNFKREVIMQNSDYQKEFQLLERSQFNEDEEEKKDIEIYNAQQDQINMYHCCMNRMAMQNE